MNDLYGRFISLKNRLLHLLLPEAPDKRIKVFTSYQNDPVRHCLAGQVQPVITEFIFDPVQWLRIDKFSIHDRSHQGRRHDAVPKQIFGTVTAQEFILMVAFVVSYIVASLFIRVAYFYLYRFAKRDTPASRALRQTLAKLTLVDFDSREEGALLHVVLEPMGRSVSPINDIQNVVEQFAIRGDVTGIAQINMGYINQTYRVETLSDAGHVHKYTLQRINTNVFRDVDALMEALNAAIAE